MGVGELDSTDGGDAEQVREDEISVDPAIEADDLEDAKAFARLGVWIAPVVIVHLFLIYTLVRAVTGFTLPSFIRADLLTAWLWINGATVALAIWLWRKGRVPGIKGRWISGQRAKRLILAWIALSIAWFLLPAVVRGIAQLLSAEW